MLSSLPAMITLSHCKPGQQCLAVPLALKSELTSPKIYIYSIVKAKKPLNFHSLFLFLELFFMCMNVLPTWIYMYLMHVGAQGAKKTWTSWSYGELWATMWVLGTKPRSSTRATSAVHLWAMSPAPPTKYFNYTYYLLTIQRETCTWFLSDNLREECDYFSHYYS